MLRAVEPFKIRVYRFIMQGWDLKWGTFLVLKIMGEYCVQFGLELPQGLLKLLPKRDLLKLVWYDMTKD